MQDDFRVEERRKPQLNAFNVFLKKFQYRNALDAALEVDCARASERVNERTSEGSGGPDRTILPRPHPRLCPSTLSHYLPLRTNGRWSW